MTYLTMLVEMMDRDLDVAAARLRDLEIVHLDLKQHVFGRAIDDLDDERRERLAALAEETGMRVFSFSSTLGHRNIDQVGEREFRRSLRDGIANMAATAATVRPAKIRLLACNFDERADYADATDYLDARASWVYAAYREAIDQIAAAGVAATIENEPHTILSTPQETVAFFARLERPAATFTWDIQNMWQSGTFPSLAAYHALRPITDYVHLKGGRSSPEAPRELIYRSPLERASWPVREIVSAVIADGVSPVLCLNPSHGAIADGDERKHLASAERTRAEAISDVAFLRANFEEIA